MRANERENERETLRYKGCAGFFFFIFLFSFFFFLFSLRGAVPAPLRVPGKVKREKFFCASRFVPAPKVQRESAKKKSHCALEGCRDGKDKKVSFALRASCPRLRFKGKARKKNLTALPGLQGR